MTDSRVEQVTSREELADRYLALLGGEGEDAPCPFKAPPGKAAEWQIHRLQAVAALAKLFVDTMKKDGSNYRLPDRSFGWFCDLSMALSSTWPGDVVLPEKRDRRNRNPGGV